MPAPPSLPDFEDLHATLHPRVLAFLRRFVDDGEAQDLAQETFLKVHQGLPDFRGESKVSTWVFQIATHLALDRVRSASYRQARLTHPMPDEVPHREGHGREPVQEEMCQCIRKMVDDLPVDYRTVICLSELREFRLGEIAGILGLTPGAVKVRLHRARKLLKERMERDCRILLDDRGEVQCDGA